MKSTCVGILFNTIAVVSLLILKQLELPTSHVLLVMVSTLVKCIQLNTEHSFAIMLQSAHNGRNVARSFLKICCINSAI
jgi:hypothetical protein